MAFAETDLRNPTRFLRQFGRSLDVGQGEHLVIDRPGVELAATLGSCVAVLLHDPVRRHGGMTHINRCVDPGPLGGAAVVAEIETLVNALMRLGTRRSDLIARVVGGAHVLRRGRDVGASIVDVSLGYIRAEAIPLAQRDLGGTRARRLLWQPTTGRMQVIYPGGTRLTDLGSAVAPAATGQADVEIFAPERNGTGRSGPASSKT